MVLLNTQKKVVQYDLGWIGGWMDVQAVFKDGLQQSKD